MNHEFIKRILEIYPPVFTACEEGGFTVEIPDLPGCISEGETREEAQAMIEEAALGWIMTALESGSGIPSSHHASASERHDKELVH